MQSPQIAHAGSGDAPAFDRAAALERAGNQVDLFRELIEIFRTDAERQLSELREALENGDGGRVRRIAHTLKGTAGIFAASAAQEAARTLESLSSDLSKCAPATEKLVCEVQRLQRALVLEL
jgi:two-component system, sensor histidine kinase and response regulator